MEKAQLSIARRTMNISPAASPSCGDGDTGHHSCACLPAVNGPVRTPLAEARRSSEPVPIWLDVLYATSCEAKRNGEYHAVRWDWVSGRALYTNLGRDAEHIEPLGVSLMAGHTMAVCWMPGETTYTVEIYRQTELCA